MVVAAVYSKSLRITSAAKSSLTTGELMNLIAVDSRNLYEMMRMAQFVWYLFTI